MLLARGYHSHSHGGQFSWIGLTIFIVVLAFVIYRARQQKRQQNSPFGPDSAGSWPPQPGGAPGWYPDHNDSSLMRYFDGQGWTSQTRLRE